MKQSTPGETAVVFEVGVGGHWMFATTGRLASGWRTPDGAERAARSAGFVPSRPIGKRLQTALQELRRKHPADLVTRCDNRRCAPCALAEREDRQ